MVFISPRYICKVKSKVLGSLGYNLSVGTPYTRAGRTVVSFIPSELDKRFQETKRARQESTPQTKNRARSIIALALESYISGKQQDTDIDSIVLDEKFANLATNRIRLFVFAGNDSSSSTIDYMYDLLSKHENASILSKLRDEHNTIFGPIPSTPQKLIDDPSLLNKCPYTLAVIKEVLRLYPLAPHSAKAAPMSRLPTLTETYTPRTASA